MLQEIYIDRNRKFVRFFGPDLEEYRWISDNIYDTTNLSNMYTIVIEKDGRKGKIIFPKDRIIVTVIE
jgi:hypothetical protein